MQMQIQIQMQMRKLHQLRSASAQHSAPACECMQNWIDAIMMIADCWCSEKTLVIQFQHRREQRRYLTAILQRQPIVKTPYSQNYFYRCKFSN